MDWDANTGRSRDRPDPGFERIQLQLPAYGGEFEVDGDTVIFRTEAASENELVRYLRSLVFALPAALSAVLTDPVYASRVEGTIGELRFSLEHVESIVPVRVLTDELLAKSVAAGIASLDVLLDPGNIRLLAATRYVHAASRLLAAGYSQWEFMSEALLNYSKALEVLFGSGRDKQRESLRAVGMNESDIEGRFIPVTLLRGFFDVAHPKLRLLDGERLHGVYLFLTGVEPDFRDLLESVRSAVTTGAWTPAPVESTVMEKDQLKTIDRIIAADERRRAGEASIDSACRGPFPLSLDELPTGCNLDVGS